MSQEIPVEPSRRRRWVQGFLVFMALVAVGLPIAFLIQVAVKSSGTDTAAGGPQVFEESGPSSMESGELLTDVSDVSDGERGIAAVIVGVVTLESDLHGIVIVSPGATLDCDGHRILGDSPTVGVAMSNDATVRNCLISGFNTGVGLGETSGALVENVQVTNSRIGFYLVNGTTSATITDSEATGNEIGFLFEPSVSLVHLEGNAATRNWRSGFMIGSTRDSMFVNNTVTGGGSGFWITNSSGNSFINNTVTGATEWFSIGVFEGSSKNVFEENEVTGGGVGIAVNSRAANNTFVGNLLSANAKGAHVEASAFGGNTFSGNQVIDNSHVGLWDDTNAAATRYTSNTCLRNKDANSVPDGLC